jgi:predicted alpha/beta-fold hydrolase
MALLVHGLGGDHRSSGIERKAHRLSTLGWRVFRMDLRGAGAGSRLARRVYTAAGSGDVGAVVDALIAAHPVSPLVVLGISLGGNIVLKLAGELGARTPANLRGFATFGPPIDLVRCSALIEQMPFYDLHYARHLTQQVAEQEKWFPDLPRSVFTPGLTLRQFDDMYTAPRWGYADALDYYRQASALPLIANIRVPTYILTARDDPFIAVEPFETVQAPSSVEIHIAEHGGHLGFLGIDALGGIRWGETELINWMTRQVE